MLSDDAFRIFCRLLSLPSGPRGAGLAIIIVYEEEKKKSGY